MFFFVNSAALREEMAKQLITPAILSEKTGIILYRCYDYLKEDCRIMRATADKLRALFGDKVVYVK